MRFEKEKEKLLAVPKVINIFDRQKIEIAGAIEVVSSTEKEVYVKLEDGFMQILGAGLKILKLIPEEQILSLAGQINGLNFLAKLTKKSIFGKVFK